MVIGEADWEGPMAVRDILRMGHAILRGRAAEVEDPTAAPILGLRQDMEDTLVPINSCGIAAPQIGIPLRVVLYRIPPDRIPAGARTAPVPWTLMVNPEITPLDEATSEIWERCLSLPGLYGRVPRYRHVGVRFHGLDGKLVEREATGFHAMILQHECDHLDGVLYPMRMTDMTQLSFASEMNLASGVFGYRPEEFD
jgi:peptide deformylase